MRVADWHECTESLGANLLVRRRPKPSARYRPHLEISLKLIERAAPDFSASIIDVGGGESTLVDDLLARGYKNVTVLDVSQTAIDVSKKRLGGSLGTGQVARRRYNQSAS